MYRKILVGGVTAAAIVGAGGTAVALTGTDSSPDAASSPVAAALSGNHAGRAGKARILKRLVHAQIVTRGPNGFVTHDLIRGTVTEVSASSITVQAADKTSETFSVNQDTKVRVRSGGKGSASSIDKVAKGDQVFVAGTGTSSPVAKHVVDVKK